MHEDGPLPRLVLAVSAAVVAGVAEESMMTFVLIVVAGFIGFIVIAMTVMVMAPLVGWLFDWFERHWWSRFESMR